MRNGQTERGQMDGWTDGQTKKSHTEVGAPPKNHFT